MRKEQAPVSFTIERNYDSEFCGSIPLHLVSLIQPHGALLTLDPVDFRMVQVSENVEQLLGIPAAEILDQPISNFLPEQQFAEIKGKTQSFIKSQTERKQKFPYSAFVNFMENNIGWAY